MTNVLALALFYGVGSVRATPPPTSAGLGEGVVATDCEGTSWTVRVVAPSPEPARFTISFEPLNGAISCYAQPDQALLTRYGWVAVADTGAERWMGWWIQPEPTSNYDAVAAMRAHLASCSWDGMVEFYADGGFTVAVKDPRFGHLGVFMQCSASGLGMEPLVPAGPIAGEPTPAWGPRLGVPDKIPPRP
jgi:hypothetical protein